MARLKKKYSEIIVPALKEELGYDNIMEIPKLEKIVLNMGVGDVISDNRALNHAFEDMTLISGQIPAHTKAKKSIANFKLQKGQAIGCKVTLRRRRMYEFLDRLINIALPRIRDFSGLSSKGFDSKGNYSFGIKEQTIFPEISYDKIYKIRGMNISFITTAKNIKATKALL